MNIRPWIALLSAALISLASGCVVDPLPTPGDQALSSGEGFEATDAGMAADAEPGAGGGAADAANDAVPPSADVTAVDADDADTSDEEVKK